MFTFFKWLLWLCLPSTVVLLGIILIALWLIVRKQLKPAILLLMLVGGLTVIMLPWTATQLGYSLERHYPQKPLQEIPKADAIVLLGGGLGSILPGFYYTECYAASDRAVMAFRLWKEGKAPVIIPTGESAAESEKPLLEAFGVPSSAILCEEKARDTSENANLTMSILAERKCKTALVVTSSWHLPRTMMLFQSNEVTFIPVSCDTEATLAKTLADRSPVWQKLPSFQSAAQTMIYAKEWLGIFFYSFRKPKPLTYPTPKATTPKAS